MTVYRPTRWRGHRPPIIEVLSPARRERRRRLTRLIAGMLPGAVTIAICVVVAGAVCAIATLTAPR